MYRQEDLTDDMAEMAKQMRELAADAGKHLKSTMADVDGLTAVADQNLVKLDSANIKLADQVRDFYSTTHCG